MAVPTRQEALRLLEEGHAALDGWFGRLSDAEMTRPATIGGGDWSAKDLLGHVAFWEELAAETLAAWREGRSPSMARLVGGAWDGVDKLNARNQVRTAAETLARVRERAGAARAALLEAIGGLSDTDWRAEVGRADGTPTTLGERLGSVTGGPAGYFDHAAAHLDDLAAYGRSLGRG